MKQGIFITSAAVAWLALAPAAAIAGERGPHSDAHSEEGSGHKIGDHDLGKSSETPPGLKQAFERADERASKGFEHHLPRPDNL